MSNDRIHDYYARMAETISDARETRNKAPDFSQYDIAYVKQFASADLDLMDAGAGTGLLLNNVSALFKSVLAVEMYPAFSDFITPRDHLTIINQDIRAFQTDKSFDLLIAFGLMNFFNIDEAAAIYRNFFTCLRPGGRLIIKNQMGRHETVIVDGVSAELGQSYYSEYRTADAESQLMTQAGFTIETIDAIYPDAFNRWPNTWFRAVVARKD